MIELTDLLILAVKLFLILMFGFPVLMTVWARVRGTFLDKPAKIILGIPYTILNCIFNWTVMTVVFWPDFPEDWYEQTTTRMKRYRQEGTGRRRKFANFVCNWLNRFDDGHC